MVDRDGGVVRAETEWHREFDVTGSEWVVDGEDLCCFREHDMLLPQVCEYGSDESLAKDSMTIAVTLTLLNLFTLRVLLPVKAWLDDKKRQGSE